MRAAAFQLTLAGRSDAAALAKLHAAAFASPWTAASLAQTLDGDGALALLARDAGPLGFILLRAVAGEAEVLTLAVDPDARRRGVGRALVDAAAERAASEGAETLWLEVAEDNDAALALYAAAGFAICGRRPGYYPRPGGAADALMMQRRLNSAST